MMGPRKMPWWFALVIAAGCAPTIQDLKTGQKFYDDWPWVGRHRDTPRPYPNPVKIAVTWSPDTLVQPGHTPTRGFGGRVYFYDERSSAVPVEGTLVVHGFDDTAVRHGEPADAADVKRFEFTPEQFTRHFSQSDLGASYSVWIPWDAVGGPQRKISLVASFQTTQGKMVQGQPATILLPGSNSTLEVAEAGPALARSYTRHRQALAAGDASPSMMTTTIARSPIKNTGPGAANRPPTTVQTASAVLRRATTRSPGTASRPRSKTGW